MQDLSQMSTEELLRMRDSARQPAMPAPAAPRAPGIIQGRPKPVETPAPPAPSTVFRTLSPDEITQRGLEPGGVYQESATGAIKVVQAPPKSRDGGAIPVSAANTVKPGLGALTALQRALDTFNPDYVGNPAGGVENTLQAYTPEMFGTVGTPGQSDWWADFRRTDNLERNELFGATLTPGEKQAYAQTTITPGMNAREARANLQRRLDIVRSALEREKEFYIANGYKPEAVEALFAPLSQKPRPDAVGAQEQAAQDGGNAGGTAALGGAGGDEPFRNFDPNDPTRGGAIPQDAVSVLGTSIGNTLIGYAQGAGEAAVDFPLTYLGAAPQVGLNNLLGGAEAMALDAFGNPQAAAESRARTARMNESTWRNAAPVQNVFNALLPAPQGYETQRDVARFAGGFLVPGPKAARAPMSAPAAASGAPRAVSGLIDNAAEIVATGRETGVPVFTTDIKPPRGGISRMVKQTIPEKIPFAGTSGPRAAQQEARVGLVEEIVKDYGGTVGRELFDQSPQAVEDIARTLGAERSRKIAQFKAAKDNIIDGVQAPFTEAPNTLRAISEQVRKLQEIDEVEFAPVIERLQRFGERIASGGTLRNVEEQRRLLGELFTDPNLARIKGRGEEALNAIYGPLRKDMGDFIERTSGLGARNRWASANANLSALAGELKSARFRGVLRDADTTPEAVNRILFSDATNISDMKRLVENLPTAGKAKVRTALIQRAFDNASGPEGVSVERFVGNLETLSGKIGVAFEGAERRSLEGMVRLLNATRRGAAAGANIRTGEQNLPTILGIGATQALGGVAGLGTLGVSGLLARLYESPMMRDRLLRLSSTKPGSAQESRMLDGIMRSAVPIVNEWRKALPSAINDNPANLAAASETQQPE